MQVLFQLSYSPTGCGVYQRPPLGPGCVDRSVSGGWSWHHRRVTTLDLLLRGGTVIDGGGGPGVRADVGVLGDRILAVGDLSDVDVTRSRRCVDCTDRIVAPGFIDPHGHSDGSLFVDGALASHLHQGFTTQLSGNCGDTLAPIGELGRELIELALRPNGLVARWGTFAEYLDRVDEQALGPNVAFLVGHGTVRGSVMGAEARPATDAELAAMVGEVEAALDAGAIGLSTGLIYAPGMHAEPAEVEALVTATARRGGLYATHMRNESDGLFASLDESIAAVRAAGSAGRLQVSHLKCGAQVGLGPGRRGDRPARGGPGRGSRRGGRPVPVHGGRDDPGDDPAARPPGARRRRVRRRRSPTRTSATSSAPRSSGASPAGRTWPPTRAGRGSGSRTPPAIRSGPAARWPSSADELHAEPSDLAFDALVADRLDVSVVIECMSEPDVETIMAVPWIAVCTDAEGRRPGHPILDAGRPHPRTYGSTARVLGRYVRDRGILSLETAIAKLTSVPAERLGLRDRGRRARGGGGRSRRVRCRRPSRTRRRTPNPRATRSGIDHVIVNGRPAIVDGAETGERAGRLLRRT